MTGRLQPVLQTTAAALATALLATALLATACGTNAAHQATTSRAADSPAPVSLATSVATTGRSWAVLVVGDAAERANDFWQLLARPAAGGTWHLVTPPGVASNGGLVVAPTGPSSLLAGFLPSQELTFTPLATTANAGATWSAGVLNADLADHPDALAADPGTARMLALLANGTLRQRVTGGTTWTTIATQQALATTPAGRRCGLTRLTGTAFSPAGDPMLAGDCSARGQTGIFTLTSGTWQPAGPGLPAEMSGQPVTTLSITSSAGGAQALLATQSGLVAARYAGDPAHWTLSQSFNLGSAKVLSVSAGADGGTAVVLSGRRGLLLARTATDWRRLPQLPPATQTLAVDPGTELQALTGTRTTVTIWTLNDSASAWTQVQHLSVPVQFGSSG